MKRITAVQREAERIAELRQKRKETALKLDEIYARANEARRTKEYQKEVEALREAREIEKGMSWQEKDAVDRLRK